MQYLLPDIEKGNRLLPFRTWDGQMVVALSCGGWRPATRLEAALLPQPRRLVIVRDMEV